MATREASRTRARPGSGKAHDESLSPALGIGESLHGRHEAHDIDVDDRGLGPHGAAPGSTPPLHLRVGEDLFEHGRVPGRLSVEVVVEVDEEPRRPARNALHALDPGSELLLVVEVVVARDRIAAPPGPRVAPVEADVGGGSRDDVDDRRQSP